MNRAVETLCKEKLVEEAKYVVAKLRDCIEPDEVTYRTMIEGFCDVGDLVEAAKLWNLMMDEGFEVDVEAGKKIMETLLKKNQFDEASKVFYVMVSKRGEGLDVSFYRVMIDWLCRNGRVDTARKVFDEMRERGIQVDNLTWASIIYGLLAKRRVAEAYKTVEGVENPDISIYHALIKGLVKIKRASEATEVFRKMIERGCEPIMHTYLMLLQGHLGRRGRKGPDPLVNFDTIFVGGMVKAGKRLEATKYVERTLKRGVEVPRFDYNKFLHCYSNEEGVVMFEEMAKKLREVGLFDLADIFQRTGSRWRNQRVRRCLSSVHRADGLDACKFLIDELKATVPIWKKEVYANGEVWKENSEFLEKRLELDGLVKKPVVGEHKRSCCGSKVRVQEDEEHKDNSS
ncbi:hypothetical protein Bca52824_008903 [Brassica carinata]|uniref:Pentatricopeptide repeat-containing protein n=1 Tax=Brassica carinata TaxID=52824 RepID=A0A8X7WC67_BRACI|nr:hypothetical protein Bca52824_008903 [Brassica carinata]